MRDNIGMDMKLFSDYPGLASLAEPWLLQILLVGLATVLANLASHFLLRHARKISRLTSSPWDDALILAAMRPVPIVIWLVGIVVVVGIVDRESETAIFDWLPQVRNIGIVLCLAWFLIRLIRNVARNIVTLREKNGEEVDHTTIDALSKLGRFS